MRTTLTLAAVLTALVLGACSTAPQTTAPVDDKSVNTTGAGSGSGANTTGTNMGGVNGSNRTAMDPLSDPASPLAKRSVYFDFDSYTVRDEFKPMIAAHGQYLASHPTQKLTIEGNTDERGSREYNIALGQKRADAVKKVLVLQGATDAQIETVSFGKEKPKAQGKDEQSYAENRRDDLVYAGH
ncbi:MAG: peptidoglycan-associated lipoprotein Pal [Proteobacteria bacterium]|nr:peptidoglycan-associated lipoprotein Pal [Pseudomonadota bacterium]